MIVNLTEVFSGIKLHIDLVLPDDPEDENVTAILKCRSHYLNALKNRRDFIEFLENLVITEAKKINPDFIVKYSNNDFFGEKEVSLKVELIRKS